MGKDRTAKEDENTEKSQKSGVNLFLLIGCILLLVIVIFLLSIHLASPNDGGVASFFSYTKADLGTLGDLLGGTLNPILSFATICLLVWSIQIQISELKETRKELKNSVVEQRMTREIHIENLKASEREAIVANSEARFKALLERYYHHLEKEICDVKYWSVDKGLIVQTKFRLKDVKSFREEELDDIAQMLSGKPWGDVHNEVLKLFKVSKKLSVYFSTYHEKKVNPLFYYDDLADFHDSLNQLCGHLADYAPNDESLDRILVQNEFMLLNLLGYQHKKE